MRLSELEPRWIINEQDRKLFIFKCPHCRVRWLSCKNFVMDVGEQMELFADAVKDEEIKVVVPMRKETCWAMKKSESWDTITIKPSIDASPSGNWHGNITSGAIT